MTTATWTGDGNAITGGTVGTSDGITVTVPFAGNILLEFATIVAGDTRLFNPATGISVQLSTLDTAHAIYWVESLYGTAEPSLQVQSGEGAPVDPGEFTGGTIALDSVTNSAAALISVTPAG